MLRTTLLCLLVHSMSGACLNSSELTSMGFVSIPSPDFTTSPICNNVYRQYGRCVTTNSVTDFISARKKDITTSQVTQFSSFVTLINTQATVFSEIYRKAKKYLNQTGVNTTRLLETTELLPALKEPLLGSHPLIDGPRQPESHPVTEELEEVTAQQGLVVDFDYDFLPRNVFGQMTASNSSNATSNSSATVKKSTNVSLKGVTINQNTVSELERVNNIIQGSSAFLSTLKSQDARNKMYNVQFQLMVGAICILSSGNGSTFVNRNADGSIASLKVTSLASASATSASIGIVNSVCQIKRLQKVIASAVSTVTTVNITTTDTTSANDVCNDIATLQMCAEANTCPQSLSDRILTSYFAPFADKLTTSINTGSVITTATILNNAIVETNTTVTTFTNGTTVTQTNSSTGTSTTSTVSASGSSTTTSSTTNTNAGSNTNSPVSTASAQMMFDASSGSIGYQVVSDGLDVMSIASQSGLDTSSVEVTVVSTPSALTSVQIERVLFAMTFMLSAFYLS